MMANYRWLWWSLLAACLTMAVAYLAVLALDWLSGDRPPVRARLVQLPDEPCITRIHQFEGAGSPAAGGWKT